MSYTLLTRRVHAASNGNQQTVDEASLLSELLHTRVCLVQSHLRAEARESFLGDLAGRGGWLIVATDWRGMSRFDFPNVIRLFLAEPGATLFVTLSLY